MDENLPGSATQTPPPAANVPAQPQAVQTPPARQPVSTAEAKYGGFIFRWAALIIDSLIVGIVVTPLTFLLGRAGLVFSAFGYGIYATLMDVYYGTTLGKKIFKMYVADEEGNRLQLGQALMREVLGKALSGLVLNLGYLWVAFDEKKQGWHDKIAKTYVVQKEEVTKTLRTIAYAIVIFQVLALVIGIILLFVLGKTFFSALTGQASKPTAPATTAPFSKQFSQQEEEKPFILEETAVAGVKSAAQTYLGALSQKNAGSLYGLLSQEARTLHPQAKISQAFSSSGFTVHDSQISGGVTFSNRGYGAGFDEQENKIYLPDTGNLEAQVPITLAYSTSLGVKSEVSKNLKAQYENDKWVFEYLGPSRYTQLNHNFSAQELDSYYTKSTMSYAGTIKNIVVLHGINESWVSFDLQNTTDFKGRENDRKLFDLSTNCGFSDCQITDDFSARISGKGALLGGKTSLQVGESGSGYVKFTGTPSEKTSVVYLKLNFRIYTMRKGVETGEIRL